MDQSDILNNKFFTNPVRKMLFNIRLFISKLKVIGIVGRRVYLMPETIVILSTIVGFVLFSFLFLIIQHQSLRVSKKKTRAMIWGDFFPLPYGRAMDIIN